MSAIRLARGVTERDLIVKFDGCYHGHSDAMLVKSGSGVLTAGNDGEASSAGVPADFARHTVSLPYNDSEAIRELFAKRGQEVAAVIVEPVAGNMGLVAPKDGFLAELRELTRSAGALLICDEVITGFRFGPSTYPSLFANVEPDIVTLGKIIGGGFAVSKFKVAAQSVENTVGFFDVAGSTVTQTDDVPAFGLQRKMSVKGCHAVNFCGGNADAGCHITDHFFGKALVNVLCFLKDRDQFGSTVVMLFENSVYLSKVFDHCLGFLHGFLHFFPFWLFMLES